MDGRDWLHAADLLRFLRLLGYGDRSRQDVRFRVPRKLQLSVHQQVGHRVLAPLAHLAVHLVPRLCVHSAWRQPVLTRTAHFQSACRMDTDRLLARCQLDVYGVGSVLWRAAHSGKEIPRRMDYAPAVRAAACLCAVFYRHRLGVLPQRFDGTGGAVPRQHVHFDGATQSVRNRISAAVLAVPAVWCCTVRAGIPASQVHPYMACTGVSGAGCPVHTVPDAPARQQL